MSRSDHALRDAGVEPAVNIPRSAVYLDPRYTRRTWRFYPEEPEEPEGAEPSDLLKEYTSRNWFIFLLPRLTSPSAALRSLIALQASRYVQMLSRPTLRSLSASASRFTRTNRCTFRHACDWSDGPGLQWIEGDPMDYGRLLPGWSTGQVTVDLPQLYALKADFTQSG